MRHLMLIGDVRKALKTLPEKSIQTCVTSPPYWGLRDYGIPGQLGLEPTPEEYVANMVEVFREVWRVLRDDGTLWLNLGDCYASSPNGTKHTPEQRRTAKDDRCFRDKPFNTAVSGLKPKDLVGQPWRVAFALQADGWYLRSDIIWAKRNPMPESVTDRPTKAHEYIFLLSKSERYFYDAEAIKEPADPKSNLNWERNGQSKDLLVPGQTHSQHRVNRSGNKERKINAPSRLNTHMGSSIPWEGNTRNKRTVWTVATKPYPGSHFATFPPDLIQPCILAGTSPRACEVCGAPWERVVERGRPLEDWKKACGADSNGGYKGMAQKDYQRAKAQNASEVKARILAGMVEKTTTGWQPTCSCTNEGKASCTVLDPFGGSGTTTMMCEQLGRDSVYIDLNPDYLELAKQRCGFGGKLIDTATYEIKAV